MEIATFILTVISTIAGVLSAIAAFGAKNEVKKMNIGKGSSNAQITGNVNLQNKGDNSGIISGVNTGEFSE